MAALLFAFLFFQSSFAFNLQTPEVYQAGLSLNNNGGVIFAGGSSSVDSSETANGPYSNLVQIYGEGEPEDGSDYRKLSSSRAALAGVVLNGTIAIFGGGQDDLQSSAPYTDVVDFLSLTDASMPIIQSARLSQPRAYLTSAATDNSAYFIAGFTNNNDSRSTVVDRYYMPTGKWSTISLPYGRAGHTSIAIGGYVFIAGGTYDQNPELGTDELTILIEDDTGAVSMLPYDTWEIRGNRSNLASAALRYDGVNYVFIGGGEGPSCGCEIGWMCTDNFSFCAADLVDIFAIYDNGTITQDFDMMQSIEPRSRLSALAYGNLVFFAGGLNITGWSAMVDIYNIETDEWTQDQLSVPRGDLTAAQSLPKCTTSNSTNLKDEVCGGVKLYFAGGIGYDGVVNVVDVYDVDTGLWVSTFM